MVEIDVPKGVRLNDRVFRTLDSELMAYAGQFYGEKNKKRIPVTATVIAHEGSPLNVVLTDADGNTGSGLTDFIAEPARKHALDEAAVRKQVDRLGTTEYMLEKLETDMDAGIMVPMSEINEARRKACEALDFARLEAFAPSRPVVKNENRLIQWLSGLDYHDGGVDREKQATQLTVWVDTVDKVKAALEGGADWIIFGGDRYSSKDVSFTDYETAVKLVRQAGRSIAFSTPRIVQC